MCLSLTSLRLYNVHTCVVTGQWWREPPGCEAYHAKKKPLFPYVTFGSVVFSYAFNVVTGLVLRESWEEQT